tara:strand:+ start:430 stop:2886 length:2457 start_codon:yes stop_codon:yes gene_type:complete
MASKTTTDPIEILLEMGIDLDNLSEEEDYLSALMEAANILTIKDATDPRIAPLQQEIVKVRKKRFAEARPNIKKTVIEKENYSKFYNNLLNTKNSAGKTPDTQYTHNLNLPALPGSKGSAIVKSGPVDIEKFKPESASEGKDKKSKSVLDGVLEGIDAILTVLRLESKLKKKESNEGRRKNEERKRKKQENKLEKNPFKKLGGVVDTMLKPVKSLWERMWDFIWNVFLGRTLLKIVDWFSDPENKGKLDAITTFLKNTWPGLLALFVAFGTGLGGFITGLIRLIGGFIPKLMGLIPKMLKGLKTVALGNPLATAAVAVAAGTAIAAIAANKDGSAVVKDEKDPDKSQADEIREFGGMTGAPMSGDMFSDLPEESPQEFKEGGQVPGRGPNKDTVRAMLAPGEFVMSRGAVQKYGTDTLESMNAAGGGNNKPQTKGGTVYAQGGGPINTKPEENQPEVPRNDEPKLGYRLGQINPETFVMSKNEMIDNLSSVQGVRQPRGQGGKVLGSTTSRGNLGTRLYQNGHLTKSFNRFRNVREYGKPEGIMRGLAGLGDLLTGDLFDFDRRTDRGNVWKDRLVTEEMGDDYRVKDDVTIKEGIAAIGKPDLIKHKDQILDQLPEGTTIQDVMSGDIPGVTSDQLLRILATSDAQKATSLKQTRARRLDEAIRGIEPGQGYSMMIGDSQQRARRQAETKANNRHAQLMKSTNPEKIAAYDKQHGEGAYSHDLKEKLYKAYSPIKKNTSPIKKNTSSMKLGENPKRSVPEPPSQPQSSVSQISATQARRNARRSTSSKKYSGEANSIGPKHPVPRDSSKAKTLGALV